VPKNILCTQSNKEKVFIDITLFKRTGVLIMVLIREVVEQALGTGYLTLAQENLLRVLLKGKYEIEDLNAFMSLQKAAMEGLVRQESRELCMFETSGGRHVAKSACHGIPSKFPVHACI
jgi:hypothetical protein